MVGLLAIGFPVSEYKLNREVFEWLIGEIEGRTVAYWKYDVIDRYIGQALPSFSNDIHCLLDKVKVRL